MMMNIFDYVDYMIFIYLVNFYNYMVNFGDYANFYTNLYIIYDANYYYVIFYIEDVVALLIF